MRAATLAEALVAMGPVRAVWTVEAVIRGALLRDSSCVSVYDALFDPTPLVAALGEQQCSLGRA